ncbi:MAG: hypothetical protein ACSHWS_13020 [Sulfitobacter sp.]
MSVQTSRDSQVGFKEIYQNEVLQSRRDRSRRAFFWARIVGLALMITIGAILRSEPQLRQMIATAGMDAVMRMAGRQQPAQTAQPAQTVALAPERSAMPKSVVKVNRLGTEDPRQDQTLDPQALARELGRALAAQGKSY